MKQFFQKKFFFLGPILAVICIALDQWTKHLAVETLKNQAPFVIWEGVLEFRYHENRGAAWGILQGKQTFFYILTVVFCAIVLYEIYRLYQNLRYAPLLYIFTLLLSGTIGNFIDRVSFQYVVDFIYVKIIDFPIFNLADCYITISVILMMILIFFYYSDKEFDDIFPFFATKNKKDE